MRSLIFCLIIFPIYGKELYDLVKYNSVVKLFNKYYPARLHSHDIKYGSGSGHQSVTGVDTAEDVNSYWLILNFQNNATNRGEPIKCNDIINLEHLATKQYLWSSQLYPSPLSSNQEVSTYNPEHGNGHEWQVMCDTKVWKRNSPVIFKHVDTGSYLAISSQTYNRPIQDQKEVCCITSRGSKSAHWVVKEGVYFKPSEDDNEVNKQKDEL